MTELFLKILDMSATAALTAAVVIVLRLIMKPAPKVFSYVLWAAVFIRLLCPISLPLPAAKVSPITPVTIRTENYTFDKNFNNAVPLSAGYTEFVPFPENSPALDREAQSRLHFGTYHLSGGDGMHSVCSITISPWGTVSAIFSPLSSNLCIGTAELNDDHSKLIVNSSDGGRYVFEIDGDSLIYRQSESTEGTAASPKELSGAYEGAVYNYSE